MPSRKKALISNGKKEKDPVNQMLIYSPHITPRLQYLAAWLGEQTGTIPLCTDNKILFEKSEELKINYSDNRISKQEIWIKPAGLLNEKGITQHRVEVCKIGRLQIFFRNESDLGFDYLSAAFYLISRYEEYFPFEEDLYGRYPHTDSIAFRNNFLQVPLVDEWTLLLMNKISMVFPETVIHPPSFNFIPTYDIDIPWKFKGKGILRNLGGVLRDPKITFRRMMVLAGLQKDSFDSYSFLEKHHSKLKLSPLYFFLTAPVRSELDKNIHPSNKRFQKLIQETANKYEVGIHPSVYSHSRKPAIKTEKDLLSSISKKVISKSRFHFLKYLLPKDYRRLIEVGVADDYTMGYGTVNGFRASTSRSFIWYDLMKEEITSLRIHPFCWMDANSYYELQMSPQESYAELLTYIYQIKKVNGTMITVSHNHLLGDDSLFQGWKEMYVKFLEQVTDMKQ